MDRRHLDGAVSGHEPAGVRRVRSHRPDAAIRALVARGLPVQHRRVLRHRDHHERSIVAVHATWRSLRRFRRRDERRKRFADAARSGADALRRRCSGGHRQSRRQFTGDPSGGRSGRCLPLLRRPAGWRVAGPRQANAARPGLLPRRPPVGERTSRRQDRACRRRFVQGSGTAAHQGNGLRR